MISLLLAVPFLFSVTPSSAPAGSDAVTVAVEGRGFTPATTARWNGADRKTVFVSNALLRVRLRPSDLVAAEPGFLTVYDRSSGARSAAARFDVVAPPRRPDASPSRQFLLVPSAPVETAGRRPHGLNSW
jgi:hypothetical protein